MGDFEIQVDDGDGEPEAASDAAIQLLAGECLRVRRDLARVEEQVEPRTPCIERRREWDAQLDGAKQPLVTGEFTRVQSPQRGASEQPLLVGRQRC